MPIVMWLFFIPCIASLILFCLSSYSEKNLRKLAFLFSGIPLGILVFSRAQCCGSNVCYPWLSPLAISFHLSIDPLSLTFLYIVCTIIPLSICVADNIKYPHLFLGHTLLLQALFVGFFTAHNLFVFTFFWEAMLVPTYFLMSAWGGPERKKVSFKFILFMIAGSCLMVAALLAVYVYQVKMGHIPSFDLDVVRLTVSNMPYATVIAAIFLLAFAVKAPLFPFHAWQPDSYCQTHISVTLILAALLSKAGIYGIMRIGLGIFPELLMQWSSLFLGCAISGVLYGALAALGQSDYKRMIAYSSLSHVNFIIVGLFVGNATAYTGVVLQVVNHSITISGLFLVAEWLKNRSGTYRIAEIKGLTRTFPCLSWLTLFFILSSVGLPGMNNFIGELLIFLGLFKVHPILTGLLGLSLILSVSYMLNWMQQVYYGSQSAMNRPMADISLKESLVLLPLVVLVLGLGIYPKPLIETINYSPYKKTAMISLTGIAS